MKTFNPDTLLHNAVESIKLGIEDYDLCTPKRGGQQPSRALSSARNLFAGTLLLVKYGISQLLSDDEERVKTLFPGKTRRHSINYKDTKKVCERLGVEIDWTPIGKLHEIRNDLEHMYPDGNVPLDRFIYNLFPFLKEFIENRLGRSPMEVIGKENWQTLLSHNDIFFEQSETMRKAWEKNRLSDEMFDLIVDGGCEKCHSVLILPHSTSPFICSMPSYAFRCGACNHTGDFFTLMEKHAEEIHGGAGVFPQQFLMCDVCRHVLFAPEGTGFPNDGFCWCCGAVNLSAPDHR